MKPAEKNKVRKAAPVKKTPAGKPSPLRSLVIWDAVIVVIAFIAFSPCLTGRFLSWDDCSYIRDNELIRVFTASNILHVFNFRTFVVGNYHPLTVLSYMIEYQAAGARPFLYHFDNLVLHLFNIMLFSWLMWLLTRKRSATLVATALFALHPMRVESVVWAAERKDVLYAFFFLLSLVCYIYFLTKQQRNYRYYILSLVFFLLSILSKGQAVVLTLILFLLDYWYRKRFTVKSLLNKVPYLLLSVGSGILAIIAQHSSLTTQRLAEHTFAERLAIATFNVTAYLYKVVFPFNLSFFYKYPAPGGMAWVYAGALAAVVLIALTAIFFRKNRVVVFGSLFFLVTLSIVSQILPVGNAIIADRYTYIPYIGLFFMAGLLLDPVITGKQTSSKVVLFAFLAVMAVFTVKTYSQSLTWHDNVSLYENGIRHDPENTAALTNLGHEYIEREDYQAAIPLLMRAVANEAADPESFNAFQNLGVAYSRTGQYGEAVRNFSAAFSRRPGYSDAIFGRGLAYTSAGRYDSAVADFTYILAHIDSLDTRSYYSRGIALNKMGQGDRAIADYTTAIRINPSYSEAYMNRGNVFFSHGRFGDAVADYDAVLRLTPDDGSCYLNRSFARFRMGRFKEALSDALKAQELKTEVNPNYISDLQKAAR